MTDEQREWYNKGYWDRDKSLKEFNVYLAAKKPIEQDFARFLAEQGLCETCKERILRFAQ